MCGITGFIDYSRKTREEDIIHINKLLKHRGPDHADFKFSKSDTAHVAVGHNRLSIIDLSPKGNQPMFEEDWAIVFNGEIYNYKEIQQELLSKGYSFRSDTDTEVVLKAFLHWGNDFLIRINGMFALALLNVRSGELLLARDRIGVKPLYYYWDQTHFVFASELKSIMAYPFFKKALNHKSLQMYLFYGYIAAPHTIFQNTYKLEPGAQVKVDQQTIEKKTYWSLAKNFEKTQKKNISEEDALRYLDNMVTESVGLRMIADVPVGSFLSGGYDSSLVTAMMKKHTGQKINTFTIGFHEKAYDEAPFAREVASYLQTDHHEEYLSVNKAKDLIELIPHYYDEPFADDSLLPMLLLSEFASKHVKVVLSGDGGDELFCGYNRYDTTLRYAKLSKYLNWVSFIKKVISPRLIANTFGRKYAKGLFFDTTKHLINSDFLLAQHMLKGFFRHFERFYPEKYFQTLSKNAQEQHMLTDMMTYLPDDILTKVDRATMAFSIEGRDPLLDYRLFTLSFEIPHSLKYRNFEKKYLLKKLTHQYIPQNLLDRPKKGFGIPVYDWLKKDFTHLLDKYCSSSFIENQEIFNYGYVKKLKEKLYTEKKDKFYSDILWKFIVFQQWYDNYM